MRFLMHAKKPAGRAAKAPTSRRKQKAPAQARSRRLTLGLVRQVSRYAIAILGVSAVSGGLFYGWKENIPGQIYQAAESAVLKKSVDLGLAIQEVYVIGREETAREDLLHAVRIQVGDPILAFDPAEIRERLENLGWIKSVEVRRTLPGTVVIRIEERRAVAIWQHNDRYVLIDPDGVEIGEKDVDRHRHLKVVVGPDAPQHTMELLSMLATEPELEDRVITASRISERRWNLKFESGVDVRLPEQAAIAAWHKLADYQRDHEILSRAIGAIDMRQPDRMTVQLSEPGLQEVLERKTGEET